MIMVQIEKQVCKRCELPKDVSLFAAKRLTCKVCRSEQARERNRTRIGMIKNIYLAMVSTSKLRGFEPVSFSLNDLDEWFNSKSNADALYDRWVANNYDRNTRPAIFRRDYTKPYTIDNLVLMSLAANYKRSATNYLADRAKPVIQYDLDGNFIAEFESGKLAGDSLGVADGSINMCCNGLRKTAHKYQWSHK